MHTDALIRGIEEYISRHSLFTKEDKILLTVSGGVDSMVMLSLLSRLNYRVSVAHCNFKLRGKESDEDTEMVKRECDFLGVRCHCKDFDTTGEMERTGDSMEMTARRLRYEWFYSLCEEEGYKVIVVAHHADDSIETFFINLLRGTGLRGLTGINGQYGKVVRPLLFATRKDILEYAVHNHIPYREDSSNHSTKYLRNKIRLGLVPMIREINSKFTPLMRGNLYRLEAAQQFIDASIANIRNSVVHHEGDIDRIVVNDIDPMYPRDFVIYELLNSAYGFKGDAVENLCRSLREGASAKRFYSREWVAYIERGEILVTRISDEDSCEVEVQPTDMRSYCGNSVLYYEHSNIDLINEVKVSPEIALLDEAKLQYPLHLRHWRDGDTFIPFGMEGHKKVGDMLTDLKVSHIERKRQFVLVSGEDIVWLVGRRIDERYAIDDDTEQVLKITKHIL